ncbi:MAG: hypothetical protein AAF682_20585 [Planctomycetota bacterium]
MRLLAAFLGLFIVSCALAVFGHRSSGVEAGTAIRMDIPELAARAELIVEARVLSAQALELPDGRIETEFVLDVKRTFKGVDLPVRAIRLPGGILPDGRGMLLAGMPGVKPGEDLLLFLTDAGDSGVRMPIGLAQGKFRVVQSATGEKVLVREQAGLSLVRPGTTEVREADGVAILPYAEVLAQIEATRAQGESR